MTDRSWIADDERTIVDLLQARLDADPDSEYLDVVGAKLSAGDVLDRAGRVSASLSALGVDVGERVATLLENSAEAALSWWGAVLAGAVAVPINTAYKGEYLRHQLADSGAKVLIVEAALLERAGRVIPALPGLDHRRASRRAQAARVDWFQGVERSRPPVPRRGHRGRAADRIVRRGRCGDHPCDLGDPLPSVEGAPRRRAMAAEPREVPRRVASTTRRRRRRPVRDRRRHPFVERVMTPAGRAGVLLPPS